MASLCSYKNSVRLKTHGTSSDLQEREGGKEPRREGAEEGRSGGGKVDVELTRFTTVCGGAARDALSSRGSQTEKPEREKQFGAKRAPCGVQWVVQWVVQQQQEAESCRATWHFLCDRGRQCNDKTVFSPQY